MPAIRVYEYGLLPPHINGDRVDQQMVTERSRTNSRLSFSGCSLPPNSSSGIGSGNTISR